jgi:hypothetical protein
MTRRAITTSPIKPRRAPARSGFTFVELCLGLVVTSLISAAVASLLLSVSACWNATAELQSATIRANQFTERLSSKLRDAKRIGTWNTGNAAVAAGLIFWRDVNNDGIMTYSELAVIQHEPTTQTIDLYTVSLGAGDPDPTWSSAALTDPSAIDNFISGLTPQPMVRNVSSALLSVSNATSSDVAPSALWMLGLAESDSTVVSRSCSASLRGPATPP